MKVYVIGSLRSDRIIPVTLALEAAGFDVFSDWFAAGKEADDYWAAYEKARGRCYRDALASPAAENTFAFDREHLDICDMAVMVGPAGKSAHLELGYIIGSEKPGFILMDEPGPEDRWDLMLRFATGIAYTLDELIYFLVAHAAMLIQGDRDIEVA